jgi:hypothetical protein
MIYRIAEHNNVYECGWIFITNGIFGKKAIVKKLAELRKHNNNILEIVKMKPTIKQLS